MPCLYSSPKQGYEAWSFPFAFQAMNSCLQFAWQQNGMTSAQGWVCCGPWSCFWIGSQKLRSSVHYLEMGDIMGLSVTSACAILCGRTSSCSVLWNWQKMLLLTELCWERCTLCCVLWRNVHVNIALSLWSDMAHSTCWTQPGPFWPAGDMDTMIYLCSSRDMDGERSGSRGRVSPRGSTC